MLEKAVLGLVIVLVYLIVSFGVAVFFGRMIALKDEDEYLREQPLVTESPEISPDLPACVSPKDQSAISNQKSAITNQQSEISNPKSDL